MPFTVAHAVAVLPFVRKRWFSPTALVVGSMSPDFEYFIRIGVKGVWGHDLPGLFLFDLPITLLIVVTFHEVVKRNFIDNLPVSLQKRVSHLKELSVRQDLVERPLIFAFSALLGALTHVVWDSFTHGTGYFVQTLDWLYQGRYVPLGGRKYPLWHVFQHLSTLTGMIILLIYFFNLKPASGAMKPSGVYWAVLFSIAAAVVTVRFQFPHAEGFPMLVIACISGLCIGVVILGLFPARKEIASV